jgi:hypothetical protein
MDQQEGGAQYSGGTDEVDLDRRDTGEDPEPPGSEEGEHLHSP